MKPSNDLPQQVRRLLDGALDLLFPPACVGCGRLGDVLCASCVGTFLPPSEPLCRLCSDPLSVDDAAGGLCARCERAPLIVAHVRSAYRYEGALREAIHAFKYGRVPLLGDRLGRLMARQVPLVELPDAVIPVPMNPARLAQRGYNHAALIAQAACAEWGIPELYRDDLLGRERQDRRQAELGAADRRANVHDAFHSTGLKPTSYRILIVDDICTTGATLDACARPLLSVGAVEVKAITLARAGHL